MPDEISVRGLPPGTPVEVFNRFSTSWVGGFEIASTLANGYQIRRLSDRNVLPRTFPTTDLRARHPHHR